MSENKTTTGRTKVLLMSTVTVASTLICTFASVLSASFVSPQEMELLKRLTFLLMLMGGRVTVLVKFWGAEALAALFTSSLRAELAAL